jgi:hypothetical protein
VSNEKWTPEAVTRVLMDPRYCLSVPTVVTDEQWIAANAKVIEQMGSETYLATLLSVVSPQVMVP